MLPVAISTDPDIMSGTPVFAGTRVPVQNLFDYLEGGYDVDGFLEDFPSVSKELALQVLQLASKALITEGKPHAHSA